MNRKCTSVSVLVAVLLLCSCGGGMPPPPPQGLDEETTYSAGSVELPFEMEGGVRYVWVKVNGVAMKMIFDTGASGVSISLTEALYLAKQGLLTQEDILGTVGMQTADGNISEGMIVNLKELELADDLVAYDVQATVINNHVAPILLGNSALKDIGSFEVDDDAQVIRFNR